MMLSLCGHPLCESCFETIKRMQQIDNPNCPTCRKPIQNGLGPITDNHPIYQRVEPKKKVCVETMVDQADFLEEITEAPAIDPIPKPDREPSLYEKLFGSLEYQPSAGGGAARLKPDHRREPPAARGDA
jgi:hypothetical protein